MRIAVHPELQGRGFGSDLLDFIVSNEKNCGRDAIGTSFGMNEPLLNFWEKSNFDIVRIGFTREKTSGEHAVIMLLPLNEEGKKINQEAQARFIEQLPFWFDDVLKDVPLEVKDRFHLEIKQPLVLNQFNEKDLHSFNQYSRNYELCIAVLNKLVIMKHDEIERDNFPEDFRQVLNKKVIKKISWKDIRIDMELSGQHEARELFHRATLYLTE